MAKSRKAKKKTVRKGKLAKRTRPAKRKTGRAKPSAGAIESAIGAAGEAAALRRRLAGRNTFEDD